MNFLSEDRKNSIRINVSKKHSITKEQNQTKTQTKILVFSWGFSKYGQTSQEQTNFSLNPVLIECEIIKRQEEEKNEKIEDIFISCGEYHSAIYRNNSSDLYMFGKNSYGQCGEIGVNYVTSPSKVRINNQIKIKKVSLGGEHSLILTSNGQVYSFGLNYFGQLGLGNNENCSEPSLINFPNDDNIIDVAAGAQHSLFLNESNNVFACGFNSNFNSDYFMNDCYGNLNIPIMINKEILLNNEVTSLRAGVNISAFLTKEKNSFLIIGIGTSKKITFPEITKINIREIDKNLDDENRIKDVKIGDDFIIVLLENGALYSFGGNKKGQLGVEFGEENRNETSFNLVSLYVKIEEIYVGYTHTIVVSDERKIYGWGSNLYGQLCEEGHNIISKAVEMSPRQFKNGKIVKIDAGGYHNIAIFKGVYDKSESETIYNANIYELSNNLSNVLSKNSKILELVENSEKKLEDFKSKNVNLDKKLSKLREKNKQIGVVPLNDLNSYSRGFENDFEISLDELYFDEDNNQIGKGTFGEVLRGQWRGEEVAVKFLKNSMLDSEESIRQFIDECNILKNLHHPNILLYMGACTTGPQFFVVTEFCENGNLFEFLHINNNQKLTFEDARRIALEIAYGVNYLHGFRPPILHRDLKSMNVLLDRNLTVKLADFGNTKSLDVQMTKQKGTFQWMAPEVIRGNKYTEKSDVFSFGIIMNELVTRVPPYKGVDKKDVARKVVNNPDYRPPFNPKKVPKDWADLMIKCWQHDENKRPDFNQVIDALLKAKMTLK